MTKEQKKLTPEQRAKQKIIESIRNLTYNKKYTLGQIEKTLGIPTNTLSGMLSGSRNMAAKWERMLSEFLKALPKEDKTITIKISEDESESEIEAALAEKLPALPQGTVTDLAEQGVAITKVSENAVPVRVDPHGEEGLKFVRAAKKTPPAGMTKAQQIRWHRENSQTLL